jgi:hypothetical protein
VQTGAIGGIFVNFGTYLYLLYNFYNTGFAAFVILQHRLAVFKICVHTCLARVSAFCVRLGVSGAAIVSGSCACPSHLWMSLVLTSSSSLARITIKLFFGY